MLDQHNQTFSISRYCPNKSKDKIMLWIGANPWYQLKKVNLLQDDLVKKSKQHLDMIKFNMTNQRKPYFLSYLLINQALL